MSALLRRPTAKRIAVLALLLVAVAASFWSSSRYPELDGKAVMGESTGLEDPLSFEALIVIQPGDSVPSRVLYSTINWLNTNRRGMALGFPSPRSFSPSWRCWSDVASAQGSAIRRWVSPSVRHWDCA